MRYKWPAVLLLFVFTLPLEVDAQQVDFETFPSLEADYQHLDLSLELEEQTRLSGQARYTLSLLRDDVDTLRLDAVRMDIQEVIWQGENLDYRLDDDRLLIPIPEGSAAAGESVELEIQYRADPAFGVHLSATETVWTSGLPGSVRHWLPVVDHPRNRFSVDVDLIIPVELDAVFSGIRGDEAAESVDMKRIRFYSDTDYAASALRFAIGTFDEAERTLGRHRIQLHAEEELLSEQEREELVAEARDLLERSADLYGVEYPSRSLSVVVLDDDRWEMKNYGAGLVWIYTNRGDLSRQMAKGVLSQWVGVRIHEESWTGAEPVVMLQAWYENRLNQAENDEAPDPWIDEPDISRDSHYTNFSARNRQAWRHWLRDEAPGALNGWLEANRTRIVEELPPVVTWYDLALDLYRETGISMMNPPRPEWQETETEEPAVTRYRVVVDVNYESEELTADFDLLEGEPGEMTVTASETGGGGSSHEWVIEGSGETVTLNVDPTLENLILETADERFVLEQEKPFDFWFHQLRTSDEAQLRAEAAEGLKQYSDNPDLQLALLDLMRDESDPAAFAAMIRTLAAVTDGSSGTSQLFQDRFGSDREPEIQIAILEAFANYPGNSSIISRLQSLILNSDHEKVRHQAIRSLTAVTEPDEFLGRSEALLNRERTEPVAEVILRQIVESGQEEAAVELGESFLERERPWRVRSQILTLLLEYDRDRDRWLERIGHYASDNDPRMRYRILQGVEILPGSDHEEILEERYYEEFDDRVRRRIDTMW